MNALIRQAMQDRLTEGYSVEEVQEMYSVEKADVEAVEADDKVQPGKEISEGAEGRAREQGKSLATIQSRDELDA